MAVLWVIPATFYVMLVLCAFYGNCFQTSLEIAQRPKTSFLFIFIINVGAIFHLSMCYTPDFWSRPKPPCWAERTMN